MSEPLPPDPELLAKWQELPQNKPSREALPPMTGGLQLAATFLIILTVLFIIGLLQGH
jgi:hypothetical protein